MISAIIFTAVVIFVSLRGCRSGTMNTTPDALLGVWKTSAPQYADRYFEVRKVALLFGMEGSVSISINPILKVERVPGESVDFYVIHYAGEGGQVYLLSFYYDPTNGGTIWFKNQMQIKWRKAG